MKKFLRNIIIGLVVSILFISAFYVLSPKYHFFPTKNRYHVIRANKITGDVEVINMGDKYH
jgi:hypothetical protein